MSVISALWVIRTHHASRQIIARYASIVVLSALLLFASVQTPLHSPRKETPGTSDKTQATSTEIVHPKTKTSERVPSIEQSNANDTVPIVRVVDGDTIVVRVNGTQETVRLIGIDAPEKQTARTAADCFGVEATNALSQMLPPQTLVTLVGDPTQDIRDRYGRLLAYVIDAQGNDIAETLLRQGYAYEYTYRTLYARHAAFIRAQQEAQASARGIWGACQKSP